MTAPITVLLAEDHTIMRQGLSVLLEADGRFRLVGGAKTGREAVDMALSMRPDVVVMDIAMPVLNGLEATHQILAVNPSARILVLSAHSDDAYIVRMRDTGVCGFLEKQTSSSTLAQALCVIAQGGTFYSPAIARRLRAHAGAEKPSRPGRGLLTRRESEVLQLVAEGSPNKQIASLLGISIKTVEKHRQHLMEKLNLHDTAGLTRYAIAAGVIESSVQSTLARQG